MKLKLLLLFLVVVGFGALVKAQTTKPYTNLVITEAHMGDSESNYFELTNMGSETIDLSNFEFGHLGAWDNRTVTPWPQGTNPIKYMILPKKTLAPGQSYLMALASDYNPKMWRKDPANYRERVTKKEFYTVVGKLNQKESKNKVKTIADLLLHRTESPGPASTDSISPTWNIMEGWGGRETYFLRHHYLNPTTGLKDSTTIDQVGGVFDEADNTNTGGSYDVAGVVGATNTCTLIRRNSIKTGNLNFAAGRGTDYADSEWIPVPTLDDFDRYNMAPWRAVFWTAGNQVNASLDNPNTLVSKTGKVLVDLAKLTITVPWGVRKNDSVMFQFKKTPGLAWGYTYAPKSADSTYISARTGDILKIYACGDKADVRDFSIIALDPTKDDNIVIPRTSYDSQHRRNYGHPQAWGGMRITDGVSPIDSITRLAFATRVDSLFKYVEKAPKATMKIVFKSGTPQPDLKTGDILRVTSESGKAKDYFIKLEKFVPSSNALLSSITWPDMPDYFRGAVAGSQGWKGDTIPGFVPTNKIYVVQIPLDYDGVPALVFHKQQLNSKVVVNRAKSLSGSVADRTVSFTVTAENDTVINKYTVRFDKEKDASNVQPFVAEPFINMVVFRSEWSTNFVQLANPGTEILDLSNYMIIAGYGIESAAWTANNGTADYKNRYMKYIPGRKWQDEASWLVKTRMAIPDNAINPMVYPGDVFVMGSMTNCNGFTAPAKHPYAKEMDINFGITTPNTPKLDNPWGATDINWTNLVSVWCNNPFYLYKITNDSVRNGLKAATDRKDFQLIESFGGLNTNNWKPDGFDAGSQLVSYTRKPNIYKGNPDPNGSWNDVPALSEWTHKRPADFNSYNLGWPWTDIAICTGIGKLTIDEVTAYRSTVTSKLYKVSLGYSANETIKGLITGTTVTGFYANLIKANALQTLTVKTASGAALADGAAISNGDILSVVSADTKNTTKYVLGVTAKGLSDNALLTSSKYTVNVVTGASTGTVGGFKQGTPLKTVFAGVTVPAGAIITITDANDAYMSLQSLNYDTAYVNTNATDKIYFEVIAENGINKIVYQLKPTTVATDAFVTSDVYSVDQLGAVIQFVPGGTTVHTLLLNVTPAPGATMVIFDKDGFLRTEGTIYRDDKLIVTAADGKTTKAYYFSMLNFYANQYLAFVISDNYQINQVKRIIGGGPKSTTTLADFIANLYPSFGATVKVLDKNGVVSKATTLKAYDQLLVTAQDGLTTAIYKIDVDGLKVIDPLAQAIKVYPNPTSDGMVIVQGLSKGNRVQVFNAAGITLRDDVIVDNATDYVSLAAQPAGIYIFVISNGDQHISIQKIVKR